MNLTVEPRLELPDKYLASASPPTTDEIVEQKLSNYGKLISNVYPTIQLAQKNDLESFVAEIAEDMPCDRILAILISDSTHAGGGMLFNVENDNNVSHVETWSGYSGAKGADVRGYFKEEYNITGSYEDIY